MVKLEILDILILLIFGQMIAKLILLTTLATSADIVALGIFITFIVVEVEMYIRDGDWF